MGAKLSGLREQGFTANSSEVLAIADELRGVAESGEEQSKGGVYKIRCVREYGDAKIHSVVEGLLYEGTVNVLTGEPGHGKSTFALAVAAAVASGSTFAGRRTSRRPVLILDRENSNVIIAERLERLGIKDGDGLTIWGGWCEAEPPGPTHPEILSWIRFFDPKPLIIFDSLIAFLDAQSENDSAEMRRFMQGFLRLANAVCTIWSLHHSGRSENNKEYRGSSDLKAAIDSGLLVIKYGETRLERLCLKPWKTRFGIGTSITLRYSDGQFSEEIAAPVRTTQERFVELLAANPGVKTSDFETLVKQNGLARDAARKFLDRGIENRTIRLDIGDRNVHMHTWLGCEGVEE